MTSKSPNKKQQLSAKVHKLKSELLEMPKPRIENVSLPIRLQVRYCWLAILILPLLAGISFLSSIYGNDSEYWMNWGKGIMALGSAIALFPLMLSIWVFLHTRKLNTLVAGQYYSCWEPDSDTWDQICQQTFRENSWIRFWSTACILGVGLVCAGMAYRDGELYFSTVTQHFLFTGMISATIGFVIGTFIHRLCVIKERYMEDRGGFVMIGPAGIYRTGEFWAFDGVTQWLESVAHSKQSPDQIELKIATSSQETINYQTVPIPFDPKEELKAKVLYHILRSRHSRKR